MKEFTGRASRSQLDRWWAAFEAGRAATDLPLERATGGESIPPPRAWSDRNPEADARLKAARPVVEARAEELAHADREPPHPRSAAPRGLESARRR